MASRIPVSPGRNGLDLRLPMPPPLLHTRSANDIYDGPRTPTLDGFTTPLATPQGSPSKSKLPPGAKELPNVFDNAMKLTPTTPSKVGRPQLISHSPNKGSKQDVNEVVDDRGWGITLGSPTRQSNKENTTPGIPVKEPSYTTSQAALSRQEPYQTDVTKHNKSSPSQALTADELEKLHLPKVKRLANVAQLCEKAHPT